MDLTQFLGDGFSLSDHLKSYSHEMFYYKKDDEEGRYHTHYLCEPVPLEILNGNVNGWVRTKERPSTKEKVECKDCKKLDKKLSALENQG